MPQVLRNHGVRLAFVSAHEMRNVSLPEGIKQPEVIRSSQFVIPADFVTSSQSSVKDLTTDEYQKKRAAIAISAVVESEKAAKIVVVDGETDAQKYQRLLAAQAFHDQSYNQRMLSAKIDFLEDSRKTASQTSDLGRSVAITAQKILELLDTPVNVRCVIQRYRDILDELLRELAQAKKEGAELVSQWSTIADDHTREGLLSFFIGDANSVFNGHVLNEIRLLDLDKKLRTQLNRVDLAILNGTFVEEFTSNQQHYEAYFAWFSPSMPLEDLKKLDKKGGAQNHRYNQYAYVDVDFISYDREVTAAKIADELNVLKANMDSLDNKLEELRTKMPNVLNVFNRNKRLEYRQSVRDLYAQRATLSELYDHLNRRYYSFCVGLTEAESQRFFSDGLIYDRDQFGRIKYDDKGNQLHRTGVASAVKSRRQKLGEEEHVTLHDDQAFEWTEYLQNQIEDRNAEIKKAKTGFVGFFRQVFTWAFKDTTISKTEVKQKGIRGIFQRISRSFRVAGHRFFKLQRHKQLEQERADLVNSLQGVLEDISPLASAILQKGSPVVDKLNFFKTLKKVLNVGESASKGSVLTTLKAMSAQQRDRVASVLLNQVRILGCTLDFLEGEGIKKTIHEKRNLRKMQDRYLAAFSELYDFQGDITHRKLNNLLSLIKQVYFKDKGIKLNGSGLKVAKANTDLAALENRQSIQLLHRLFTDSSAQDAFFKNAAKAKCLEADIVNAKALLTQMKSEVSSSYKYEPSSSHQLSFQKGDGSIKHDAPDLSAQLKQTTEAEKALSKQEVDETAAYVAQLHEDRELTVHKEAVQRTEWMEPVFKTFKAGYDQAHGTDTISYDKPSSAETGFKTLFSGSLATPICHLVKFECALFLNRQPKADSTLMASIGQLVFDKKHKNKKLKQYVVTYKEWLGASGYNFSKLARPEVLGGFFNEFDVNDSNTLNINFTDLGNNASHLTDTELEGLFAGLEGPQKLCLLKNIILLCKANAVHLESCSGKSSQKKARAWWSAFNYYFKMHERLEVGDASKGENAQALYDKRVRALVGDCGALVQKLLKSVISEEDELRNMEEEIQGLIDRYEAKDDALTRVEPVWSLKNREKNIKGLKAVLKVVRGEIVSDAESEVISAFLPKAQTREGGHTNPAILLKSRFYCYHLSRLFERPKQLHDEASAKRVVEMFKAVETVECAVTPESEEDSTNLLALFNVIAKMSYNFLQDFVKTQKGMYSLDGVLVEPFVKLINSAETTKMTEILTKIDVFASAVSAKACSHKVKGTQELLKALEGRKGVIRHDQLYAYSAMLAGDSRQVERFKQLTQQLIDGPLVHQLKALQLSNPGVYQNLHCQNILQMVRDANDTDAIGLPKINVLGVLLSKWIPGIDDVDKFALEDQILSAGGVISTDDFQKLVAKYTDFKFKANQVDFNSKCEQLSKDKPSRNVVAIYYLVEEMLKEAARTETRTPEMLKVMKVAAGYEADTDSSVIGTNLEDRVEAAEGYYVIKPRSKGLLLSFMSVLGPHDKSVLKLLDKSLRQGIVHSFNKARTPLVVPFVADKILYLFDGNTASYHPDGLLRSRHDIDGSARVVAAQAIVNAVYKEILFDGKLAAKKDFDETAYDERLSVLGHDNQPREDLYDFDIAYSFFADVTRTGNKENTQKARILMVKRLLEWSVKETVPVVDDEFNSDSPRVRFDDLMAATKLSYDEKAEGVIPLHILYEHFSTLTPLSLQTRSGFENEEYKFDKELQDAFQDHLDLDYLSTPHPDRKITSVTYRLAFKIASKEMLKKVVLAKIQSLFNGHNYGFDEVLCKSEVDSFIFEMQNEEKFKADNKLLAERKTTFVRDDEPTWTHEALPSDDWLRTQVDADKAWTGSRDMVLTAFASHRVLFDFRCKHMRLLLNQCNKVDDSTYVVKATQDFISTIVASKRSLVIGSDSQVVLSEQEQREIDGLFLEQLPNWSESLEMLAIRYASEDVMDQIRWAKISSELFDAKGNVNHDHLQNMTEYLFKFVHQPGRLESEIGDEIRNAKDTRCVFQTEPYQDAFRALLSSLTGFDELKEHEFLYGTYSKSGSVEGYANWYRRVSADDRNLQKAKAEISSERKKNIEVLKGGNKPLLSSVKLDSADTFSPMLAMLVQFSPEKESDALSMARFYRRKREHIVNMSDKPSPNVRRKLQNGTSRTGGEIRSIRGVSESEDAHASFSKFCEQLGFEGRKSSRGYLVFESHNMRPQNVDGIAKIAFVNMMAEIGSEDENVNRKVLECELLKLQLWKLIDTIKDLPKESSVRQARIARFKEMHPHLLHYIDGSITQVDDKFRSAQKDFGDVASDVADQAVKAIWRSAVLKPSDMVSFKQMWNFAADKELGRLITKTSINGKTPGVADAVEQPADYSYRGEPLTPAQAKEVSSRHYCKFTTSGDKSVLKNSMFETFKAYANVEYRLVSKLYQIKMDMKRPGSTLKEDLSIMHNNFGKVVAWLSARRLDRREITSQNEVISYTDSSAFTLTDTYLVDDALVKTLYMFHHQVAGTLSEKYDDSSARMQKVKNILGLTVCQKCPDRIDDDMLLLFRYHDVINQGAATKSTAYFGGFLNSLSTLLEYASCDSYKAYTTASKGERSFSDYRSSIIGFVSNLNWGGKLPAGCEAAKEALVVALNKCDRGGNKWNKNPSILKQNLTEVVGNVVKILGLHIKESLSSQADSLIGMSEGCVNRRHKLREAMVTPYVASEEAVVPGQTNPHLNQFDVTYLDHLVNNGFVSEVNLAYQDVTAWIRSIELAPYRRLPSDISQLANKLHLLRVGLDANRKASLLAEMQMHVDSWPNEKLYTSVFKNMMSMLSKQAYPSMPDESTQAVTMHKCEYMWLHPETGAPSGKELEYKACIAGDDVESVAVSLGRYNELCCHVETLQLSFDLFVDEEGRLKSSSDDVVNTYIHKFKEFADKIDESVGWFKTHQTTHPFTTDILGSRLLEMSVTNLPLNTFVRSTLIPAIKGERFDLADETVKQYILNMGRITKYALKSLVEFEPLIYNKALYEESGYLLLMQLVDVMRSYKQAYGSKFNIDSFPQEIKDSIDEISLTVTALEELKMGLHCASEIEVFPQIDDQDFVTKLLQLIGGLSDPNHTDPISLAKGLISGGANYFCKAAIENVLDDMISTLHESKYRDVHISLLDTHAVFIDNFATADQKAKLDGVKLYRRLKSEVGLLEWTDSYQLWYQTPSSCPDVNEIKQKIKRVASSKLFKDNRSSVGEIELQVVKLLGELLSKSKVPSSELDESKILHYEVGLDSLTKLVAGLVANVVNETSEAAKAQEVLKALRKTVADHMEKVVDGLKQSIETTGSGKDALESHALFIQLMKRIYSLETMQAKFYNKICGEDTVQAGILFGDVIQRGDTEIHIGPCRSVGYYGKSGHSSAGEKTDGSPRSSKFGSNSGGGSAGDSGSVYSAIMRRPRSGTRSPSRPFISPRRESIIGHLEPILEDIEQAETVLFPTLGDGFCAMNAIALAIYDIAVVLNPSCTTSDDAQKCLSAQFFIDLAIEGVDGPRSFGVIAREKMKRSPIEYQQWASNLLINKAVNKILAHSDSVDIDCEQTLLIHAFNAYRSIVKMPFVVNVDRFISGESAEVRQILAHSHILHKFSEMCTRDVNGAQASAEINIWWGEGTNRQKYYRGTQEATESVKSWLPETILRRTVDELAITLEIKSANRSTTKMSGGHGILTKGNVQSKFLELALAPDGVDAYFAELSVRLKGLSIAESSGSDSGRLLITHMICGQDELRVRMSKVPQYDLLCEAIASANRRDEASVFTTPLDVLFPGIALSGQAGGDVSCLSELKARGLVSHRRNVAGESMMYFTRLIDGDDRASIAEILGRLAGLDRNTPEDRERKPKFSEIVMKHFKGASYTVAVELSGGHYSYGNAGVPGSLKAHVDGFVEGAAGQYVARSLLPLFGSSVKDSESEKVKPSLVIPEMIEGYTRIWKPELTGGLVNQRFDLTVVSVPNEEAEGKVLYDPAVAELTWDQYWRVAPKEADVPEEVHQP